MFRKNIRKKKRLTNQFGIIFMAIFFYISSEFVQNIDISTSLSDYWGIANYFDINLDNRDLGFDFDNKVSAFNPLVTEDCPLCHYNVSMEKKITSSIYDVIIVSGISKFTNVLLFLRTLRTVGSIAQVYILVDTDCYEKMSPDTINYVKLCGGNIIPFINTKKFAEQERFAYGYFGAYRLMKLIWSWANRVIICDLFDIVFQGDPFDESINNTHIQFTDEHFLIRNCGTNVGWIKAASKGEWNTKWGHYKLLNSGFFAGTVPNMIRLIDLFASVYDPLNSGTHDQGYFNYLNVTGVFTNVGLDHYHLYDKDIIRHLYNGPAKESDQLFGNVSNFRNQSLKVKIVHQYYRNKNLSLSILKACPRLTPNLNQYHRLFRDMDLSAIEQNL